MIYLTLKDKGDSLTYIANGFNSVEEGLRKISESNLLSNLDWIEIHAFASDNMPTQREREDKVQEGYICVESKHLPLIVEMLNSSEDKEYYNILLNAELENLCEELEQALEFDARPLIF